MQDVLVWLLDGHAAIRWQVLRDFEDASPDDNLTGKGDPPSSFLLL
ncbi:hypothetical protein ACLH0K_17145 [Arthrobacter sp. MPF02]